MKLLSLKINQTYKSLDRFEYDFKEIGMAYDHITSICFVGLNGSGKSNIIEALSEIFCFLDLYCLEYIKTPKWALKSPLSFEIEYLLYPATNKERHIRIKAVKDKSPELFGQNKNDDFKSIPLHHLKSVLPHRIIGYSSGQNETISFPYLRNQGFYADEVLRKALGRNKNEIKDSIPHTKTLFMDYDSNALILLSNWLFQTQDDLKLFSEYLRIKAISSFRIAINLDKGNVKLTKELENTISDLKTCALIYDEDSTTQMIVIDYIINSATRQAFQEIFKTAQNFFTAIYKLNLLNAISLTKKERDFYTQQNVKGALLEKPPSVPKERKVFCIDQLKLILTEPQKEIDYVGISDGEHQFIHIIGTVMLFNESNILFLLDEPESHYNPKWRSHFIQILQEINHDVDSEFVISTHSPYVISGCKKENVVKFYRKKDVISYTSPKRETFRNSFEFLLKDLFELDSFIDQNTRERLKNIIKSKNLDKMNQAVFDFAESREKRYLYQAIEIAEQQDLKK